MRSQFVLFGSSHVQYSYYQGWGATLSHLYARKADVILRGYAAWNSRRALQVVDEIFPENATEHPALVILYFGGNDSTRLHISGNGPHVPKYEYKENMRKIVNHIKKVSEKTRIIFLSVPPINDEKLKDDVDEFGNPRRTNEDCRLYSEVGLELCRELNIKGIDLWSAFQKIDDWENVCLGDDGIHFSPEGSDIVSREILNLIRNAEWEPNLHWSSMLPEFGEDSPYDPVLPDGTTINISNFNFPIDVEWARKILI